jgi:hypothetical protein
LTAFKSYSFNVDEAATMRAVPSATPRSANISAASSACADTRQTTNAADGTVVFYVPVCLLGLRLEVDGISQARVQQINQLEPRVLGNRYAGGEEVGMSRDSIGFLVLLDPSPAAQVAGMSLAEIYVVPVASAIIRRNSEASEVGG